MTSPRSAFSAIELLVTVAIIAVLTAILLPVVGSLRETTRKLVCASNQRQIYGALAAYALDNRGWMPATRGNIRPNRKDWNPLDVPTESSVFGQLWARGYFEFPEPKSNANGQVCRERVLHCPSQQLSTFSPAGGLAGQQVTFFRFCIGDEARLQGDFIGVVARDHVGYETRRPFTFGSIRPVLIDSVYYPDTNWPGTPIDVHRNRGLTATYGDGSTRFANLPENRMRWCHIGQMSDLVTNVLCKMTP